MSSFCRIDGWFWNFPPASGLNMFQRSERLFQQRLFETCEIKKVEALASSKWRDATGATFQPAETTHTTPAAAVHELQLWRGGSAGARGSKWGRFPPLKGPNVQKRRWILRCPKITQHGRAAFTVPRRVGKLSSWHGRRAWKLLNVSYMDKRAFTWPFN